MTVAVNVAVNVVDDYQVITHELSGTYRHPKKSLVVNVAVNVADDVADGGTDRIVITRM
jgi:hypothetical protein